jgi:hypothetical protein
MQTRSQQLAAHYAFVLEPLAEQPDFLTKPMFGCLALYFDTRIMLVLANKHEPWNGLLLPTTRESHASLQAQFSALMTHNILSKWLYISQTHPDFESVANELVELVLCRDSRIGVIGKPKKKSGH